MIVRTPIWKKNVHICALEACVQWCTSSFYCRDNRPMTRKKCSLWKRWYRKFRCSGWKYALQKNFRSFFLWKEKKRKQFYLNKALVWVKHPHDLQVLPFPLKFIWEVLPISFFFPSNKKRRNLKFNNIYFFARILLFCVKWKITRVFFESIALGSN